MTVTFARNFQLILCGLLVVFIVTLGVDAQTKDGKNDKGKNDKNDKGKNDGPDTAKYLNQLRQIFSNWDTNKDGNADPEELAKVIRGPAAKGIDTTGDLKKAESLPEYALYKQLDRNSDWLISRAEFDTWAKAYAEQLAEQEELLERIAMKQRQLEKENAKSKNYEKLKNELQKEREQANRLKDKIQAQQKQIQQQKRNDNKNDNKNDKKKN